MVGYYKFLKDCVGVNIINALSTLIANQQVGSQGTYAWQFLG